MSSGRLFCVIVASILVVGGCEQREDRPAEADLHWAAYKGDIRTVQSLILQGISVHARNYHGSTALHEAAEGGHLHVARLLIANGARIDTPDKAGQTPAVVAMVANRKSVAEYLVSQGAAVNLHLAAYLGDTPQVRTLIDSGVDVNDKNPTGWPPLHYAASQNQQEVVKLLITAGADVNAMPDDNSVRADYANGTALHRAVSAGHTDIVELLIDSGADLQARDRYGMTPLCSAAQDGQLEMVKLLLAMGADADAQARDNYFCGGIPLGITITYGHFDITEALIGGGADVNARDESGWTPLHLAAMSDYVSAVEAAIPMVHPAHEAPDADRDRYIILRGKVRAAFAAQMMQLLVEHGADVNAKDEEGITPLHCAAYEGLQDGVATLIASGAGVNAKTLRDPRPESIMWERDLGFRLGPGVTPLHEAVIGGDPGVVDLLIVHGAQVNAQGESGDTPLHYAAARAADDMVSLLIAKGADVNAADASGATPLAVALRNARVRAAEILIAAGAEEVVMRDQAVTTYVWYTEEENLLLHRALSKSRGEAHATEENETDLADFRRQWLELLLTNGADPNERDGKGDTPLHIAVELPDANAAKLLMDYGANVNARNRGGVTPLHCAAAAGGAKIISLLLAKGADVNARDSHGETPLHDAALRGHKQAVELLIAGGADPSIKDNTGRTPRDEARRLKHDAVADLLRSRAAKE